jgi:serine protease Do
MLRRMIPLLVAASAALVAAPVASAQPARAPAPGVDRSDRVARATVAIVVGDAVRAQGVVLANDGRIVTAIAPLAGARSVTVRYPNGRSAGATVVATDAAWGLALLQPRTGVWLDGLPLATAARGNTPVRWMAGPSSRAGLLLRRRTYVGPGAALLRDAWEMNPAPGDDAVGSGIANAAGELVAVVVPPDPGVSAGASTVPFGAPAPVIGELVASAGNTARPWVGFVARNLRGDELALAPGGGIRVTEVTAQSPADRAGIRAGAAGDIIVAVDERAVRTVEDLGAVLEGHHPTDTLMLSIVRDGTTLVLPLLLGAPPPIGP